MSALPTTYLTPLTHYRGNDDYAHYQGGSMHMTGSAPAPPPIDFNDPLQYQVMQANRWSQERQLEEQRSHIVFGGPEDVVPKASVPTRWSQKITETSHTFRGPDTFSQQELAYEHAHRHSTRGGRIYMPPSQLTIKEGGYVPAKEQRLSRMPAPDDLSQKDRVRALMTDDMPQPLDEKYYYDHMGAVKPWDREKMSHRPTQAADQLRWDGRYSPPTLPKKHAGGTGAGSSAHKSVVDELAFGHDVDYSMGIPYHLDRAKQSEGRREGRRTIQGPPSRVKEMAMQWNPVDNASPQLTRNPGAQYPAPTPSHVLSPMQVQQLQQRYGGGGGAPPGSAGPPQTPGELILAQKQHEEQRRQGPSQMMPPVREQPQTWREAAAPAPPAYEPSRMHYGELPPQPAPAAAAPSGFSGGHGHDWSQGRDYGMDAATYIEHGGRLTPPAPPPQMAPPQALLSPQVAAARADYRAQYGQQQEQQYGNPGSAQAPQGQTIRGPGVLWPEEYGDRGQPGHAPPEVLAHAQRAVLAHDTASAQARAAMGAVQASPSQPSHGGYHQPAPLGAYPHQQQGAYGSPVMEPPQATWRHMQMQEAGGLSRHDSKPVHGRSPLAGFAQRNVSQGGFA